MKRSNVLKRTLEKLGNFYNEFELRVRENKILSLVVLCLVALLGILSNIVANKMDNAVGLWILFGTFVLLVILSLGFWRTSKELPDDLILAKYSANYINTPALIREANELSRKVFGPSTIPDREVENILLKNKHACLGLFEHSPDHPNGRLVGYASCWPIPAAIYNRLRLGEGVEGGMSEAEFQAEHILSDAEIGKAEVIFIPAVAVLDRETYAGKFRAAVLAGEFVRHLKMTYDQTVSARGGITIFLVGFSKQGQKMTERLAGHLGLDKPTGFLTIYGEQDKPFYEKYLLHGEWEKALDRILARLFRALYSGEERTTS
jgi:hypothetical protein